MSRQQQFNNIISNIYNPAYPQLLIDKFHRYNGFAVGLNTFKLSSLVWNPNHKIYQDQDLDSRFYYEYPINRSTGEYNDIQMAIFLRDKPLGSSIYLVNLGRNSRIREYTITNHLVIYRNCKCMLLTPIGTY